MYLPNKNCNICLISEKDLVNACDVDPSNVKWSTKLDFCVPEVEWTEDTCICNCCISQLEAVYAFRNLCIQSSFLRKKASTSEEEPEIKSDADGLTFRCLLCDKAFETNDGLAQHELVHSSGQKYSCDTCNMRYNSQVALNRHKIIVHTDPSEWKYVCQFCNSRFPLKSTLSEHLRDKHADKCENSFTCFHCGQAFRTKILIAKHIRTKHNQGVTQLKCKHCEKRFRKQVTLDNHVLKTHTKTEEEPESSKLHVTDCNQGNAMDFDDIDSEESDLTENNAPDCTTTFKRGDSKEVVDTCETCGVTFTTKYLLKRHIRNVHAVEKKYRCETCGQKFASPVYLSAHKRYHSRERKYVCSFCGKGYITASDLYHHEKIHANLRAYRCEKCPKAFNTSSDLHKHKICVHLDRKEWKYVCEFCQRRFPLKTNLDTHTKTHTGERNFPCHLCDRKCINRSVLMRHIESHSNVRMFKCATCSQDYKYQKSLDIHMAKAHGIGELKVAEKTRKYFCHVCFKSYAANNKLQKHIRSHTGERPFSCHICDKRFIDKSYVKQHLKTAHNVVSENCEFGAIELTALS